MFYGCNQCRQNDAFREEASTHNILVAIVWTFIAISNKGGAIGICTIV